MCGRYIVDDETERDIRRLAALYGNSFTLERFGDVLPSQKAAVLTKNFEPHIMTWGFTGMGGSLLINARGESVLQKPTFASHVRERRCLIPAAGFYEWDKARVRYTFTGQGTLWMAGFYRQEEEGQRFVIITVPANELMRPVHDRMPRIFSEEEASLWIDEKAPVEELLVRPAPVLEKAAPYEQQSLF